MSKEGASRKTRLRSIKIVLGIILILTALILVSAVIYASSEEGGIAGGIFRPIMLLGHPA